MEIVTPRLKLRLAREEDLLAMHAVLSDARATRWWSTPPHQTLDQTQKWLSGMIEGDGGLDFVVELNGRVIGKAGFWRAPDIGYILHPDSWGHGYAAEAVAATLDRLFAVTDYPAATADVDPDNAASIRLLERLAFSRTGFAANTWNVGGEMKDSYFYEVTREVWRARQVTV